jgi:hypothetical protein
MPALVRFELVVRSQDDEEGAGPGRRLHRLDGEAPPRFAEQWRETERQCSTSRYAEPLRAVILGLMLPAKEQPGVDAVIRSVFVAQ